MDNARVIYNLAMIFTAILALVFYFLLIKDQGKKK